MTTTAEKEGRTDHVRHHKSDRFPLIVMVIVIAEFCERFSYSGMKAFLTLYLKSKLMYSDDEATEIYHTFSSLIYFFPIIGALVADNYLGKYKTIVCMMFVYAIGNSVIALAAIPQLEMPGRMSTMIGLILIGFGAGGIKPCVAAFGGDQFEIPRQEKHLAVYFSVLYFALCFGSLISKTISPLLRSEIQCFGEKDCYSVAFGAPGIIMLSSIVIFSGAKRYYVMKKPTGNIILKVVKCITLGVKNKFRTKTEDRSISHWLDSTQNIYDANFITDVKRTLSVLVLYIPLPIFWALLDQMGSRWTLQAARMDGDLRWFTVRPDQMQVSAPFIILCFIPIFQKVIYPCLEKVNLLVNPLHKLTLGGILAGVAFILSGCLELHLQKTYPQLPQKNFSQIRIFNGYNCPISINNSEENIFATIAPYSLYVNKRIPVKEAKNLTLDIECECRDTIRSAFLVQEHEAISFYLTESGIVRFVDNIAKSRSGNPYVRFMTDGVSEDGSLVLFNKNREEKELTIFHNGVSEINEVFASKYALLVKNRTVGDNIELRTGGVYSMLVQRKSNTTYVVNKFIITDPNTVPILLLIPQFFVISIGEVLFAVTGLEFSFKEAPESMKSVLQASWLLTEALGNVIIIIITRLAVNYDQATQSFIYTGLMLTSMIIFYFLAKRYEITSTYYKNNSPSKEVRSNSEVLYMQVKQCEQVIEH